jgi:GH15 family glucan-1,4-alpha-glucosidase
VIQALNRLGAADMLENYLRFLRNLIDQSKGGHIQPLYGIGLEAALPERIVDSLPGYLGMGPVRVGNQAHEHLQHDVYGQIVLSATQAFSTSGCSGPRRSRISAPWSGSANAPS